MLTTGIEHIISPWSAPWCGWIILALLVCAVLSEFMQPGIITQAHSSLLAQTDRTYKESPMNLWGQVFITLFRLGTIALAIYMSLYSGGTFGFGSFALIGGLTVGVLLVKMAGTAMVDYTFQISRRFMPSYNQYSDITTIAVCLLYPGLLIVMRIGDTTAIKWLIAGIAALFILLITYRFMRNYMVSLRAVLYVILYVMTLEVLPMGALFYLSSITIDAI